MITKSCFTNIILFSFMFYLSACGGGDSGESPPPITYTLTITKVGNGEGQITSNPAGINCGGDCSESYVSGTTVTLTESPAVKSQFTGWFATNDDCLDGQVTLNSDISCTAGFDETCDPITQDCTTNGEGCFHNLTSGTSHCIVPVIGTPPGEQGDSCSFLNGCAIGYGCMLNDDPVNPQGLACALYCDATNPGASCDAGGVGLTCVQINQFVDGARNVPDVLGMCVDCSTYTCP